MKFLLAPDSFKGSLGALQVSQIMRKAVLELWPQAQVDLLPMADGGEGTLEVCLAALGGQRIPCRVQGPLGCPIDSSFGLSDDGKLAFVEMASASGLTLIPAPERDVMRATSFGTGQLLRAALDAGAETILLGIGGSAHNDGGAGLLQALGFHLLDVQGQEIKPGAEGLRELRRIDRTSVHPRLARLKLRVACDVSNPLLGPQGASAVFGPQKGAQPAHIPLLEAALAHFAEAVEAAGGRPCREQPGAGAAGGAGFALMSLLDADLRSGFDVLAELIQLPQRLQREHYDFILSGEGSLDEQTMHGKLLARLGALARQHATPLIAFAGRVQLSPQALDGLGITHAFSIVEGPCTLEEAVRDAPELLARCVRRVFRLIHTPSPGKGKSL